MNWYKKAQYDAPIKFLSWKIFKPDVTGEMAIAFNRKRYVYYDISREEANHISSLLGHKNFSATAKILKFYKERYDRKLKQERLTPRGYVPEEEQQMLNDLEENNLLSGTNS